MQITLSGTRVISGILTTSGCQQKLWPRFEKRFVARERGLPTDQDSNGFRRLHNVGYETMVSRAFAQQLGKQRFEGYGVLVDILRTSPRQSLSSVDQVVDDLVSEAEGLVRLWDRAEDWAVPRIPPSQIKMLGLLRYRGRMNLSALAAESGTTASSASRLCDRLEISGLIQRDVPVTNRREVWLSLTREGQHRLESFDDARRDDLAEVVKQMSPEARAALLMGLREFSIAATETHEALA